MTKEFYIKIGFDEETAKWTEEMDNLVKNYLIDRNERVLYCYKKMEEERKRSKNEINH